MLKLAATFACVLLLTSGCASVPMLSAAARPQLSLKAGWRFHFGDVSGAEQLRIAPADWASIDLPHTWNARDGANGGNDYARGPAWYLRTFESDRTWQGRRVFLQFDGVSRKADVFLNGTKVGSHLGAFARFRCDITDALASTGANTLAVRVDNAEDGTAPISADFTFFGGIYREVKLFTTDAIHIDAVDFGADAVYVAQEKVSAERADLRLRIRLRNDAATDVKAHVRAEILDADGGRVAVIEDDLAVARQADASWNRPLAILHPHLWRGRADPYLHKVKISVFVDGRLRDVIYQRLGLRSYRVDPEKGFFLNGEHLDLHGVSRHQDRASKGWAIEEAEDHEDFALIKEMGATALRVAHYPQSDLWFDLADESGLVVWAEIPVVNEVPATPLYADNAAQQLRELIRQHFNHPSICFWGVGNETREVGDTSGHETVNAATADRVIAALNDLAHAEDPTRLSTYASHHKNEDVRNFHTDVIAFNKYPGWYGGKADDFATWADAMHKAHPSLSIGVSEYGYGANPAQHEDSPKSPTPTGAWHPEEYQSSAHETLWLAMNSRDFLWVKFIWNMFDFASDQRSEGAEPGMNDKGLITYDRKLKKDAFYWYKANWSDAPVLHITGRRFVVRPAKQTEIKVYANASQVELFVNGESQGVVANVDHIFRWRIDLTEGVNRIVARAGGLTDECTLMLSPKGTQ